MGYDYSAERPHIFTEDGQKLFLQIRDKTQFMLKSSGAFMLEQAISGCVGVSWHMLACVDRLVELGEIYELKNTRSSAGQHRVFVSAR